jgi:hypothetical protein
MLLSQPAVFETAELWTCDVACIKLFTLQEVNIGRARGTNVEAESIGDEFKGRTARP